MYQWTTRLTFIVLFSMAAASGSAQLASTCATGCLPRDEFEQTPDLLLRANESMPVTLQWSAPTPPAGDEETVVLYAGNPMLQDAIPERGPLVFEAADGRWAARHEFEGSELGRGTFLTVVVHRAGSRETILEWRAWRLVTAADRARQVAGPPPASAWELDIVPSLLQVSSGRGDLPRSRGGDTKPWWSLALLDSQFVDLDIDGAHTGVPGVSVHMTQPWPAGEGPRSWKDAILDQLQGVEGHTIRFGDLTWVEVPDREVNLGTDSDTLLIRHYYSIVSLFSTASFASLDRGQISGGGVGRKRYFSHETSARLKTTRDPRFWPSYSRRELSADPHLLELLEKQTRGGGTVPGIGGLQRGDGDGGPPVFQLAFTARIAPWEATEEEEMKAGFVAIDAVAARAGYGAVITKGSSGRSEIEQAMCQVLGCDNGGSGIDLDDPPRGYKVEAPSASLETKTGSLPLVTGEPTTAARDERFRNFPDTARFAVAAHLRSGALLRKGGWGRVKDVAPLNAYAQFVVKFTVVMYAQTELITNDEAILLDPAEADIVMPVVKRRGLLAWLAAHKTLVGLIVLGVILIALMIYLPGLRALVNAIFKRLAKLVEPKPDSDGGG